MLIKTFKSNLIELQELETETINGKRHYIIPGLEGVEKYPSVTTVLDATADKSYLETWKTNVGEDKANKIAAQARNRGTALHNMCERYVTNLEVDFRAAQPAHLACFLQVKKALDEHADNIRFVEGCLYSNLLKVAGRCDLICEWDGEIAIVDYKTSGKLKRKEWITDYLCQASTYAYMFWERTGIMVKKIVILVCVEDNPIPQVFEENPANYIRIASERYKQYHSM